MFDDTWRLLGGFKNREHLDMILKYHLGSYQLQLHRVNPQNANNALFANHNTTLQ